jgi:2'-5' RNA ligase
MTFDTRLFTGLSLPPEATKNFEELLAELEPLAQIGWSPVSQLHITTKFIGTWSFQRLPELARFLGEREPTPKFSLTLKGLRYFKMPLQGWVLYAKVEPSEGLDELAAALDQNLAHYGLLRTFEDYLPHVTIGRVPGNNPWPELDNRVEAYTEKPLGTFEVSEYHLYESTQSGYRKVCSIPLA